MSRTMKIAGTALVAAFALLLFMSKTIYSYNIPEVTAVTPVSGKLKKEELVTGIAQWSNVLEKYFELSGYVEEIYAKEGDWVKQGDPVVSFRFDREDLEKQRQQLGLDRSSLNLSIENIQLRIANIGRQIENLEKEQYETKEISVYDLNQQIKKIENAYEELEKKETLFDAGAIAQRELDDARQTIEQLEDEYENMTVKHQEALSDEEKSLEDQEKARTEKIEDYHYELETLNQDLKEKSLSLQELQIKEDTIAKNLAQFNENQTLYAQEDGIVLSMEVKKGQFVNANQLVFALGMGNEFLIECEVNLKNNFIDVGDICKLGNTDKTMEGEVTKLEAGENGKIVTVRVESDAVAQGETFDVRFYKESARNFTLVPNSALRMDSDGYFVYYLKQRTGILGEEYYVDKSRVSIGDSDNENTVITNGITFFEPLAGYSNKTLVDYDAVKVKNESDFFVK